MIKKKQAIAEVMEFTSFKKKENVTDDELIQAVIQFENSFLASQENILFHCLVRNFNNEYANVLFADNMNSINKLFEDAKSNNSAKHFFSLIENESVKITIHQIEKENFVIPENFSCVEHGTFSLKEKNEFKDLIKTSNTIEQEYLNKLENTKAHFIGTISENVYSEITFGETLGKTKEACFAYMENVFCKPLLEMADETTMKLDFWYLIA